MHHFAELSFIDSQQKNIQISSPSTRYLGGSYIMPKIILLFNTVLYQFTNSCASLGFHISCHVYVYPSCA